jgi:hypothetical protein
LQQTRRWSHELVPQWHWHAVHCGPQIPLAPHPHEPHVALQST